MSTAVLLPEQLHAKLARLAEERGVSVGELVNEACKARFDDEPRDEEPAVDGEPTGDED